MLVFWFWNLLILHKNQEGILPSPVYKHLKGSLFQEEISACAAVYTRYVIDTYDQV